MPKPTPRELEVIRTTSITKNMLRVTLGGEAMSGFPQNQESAYIKLIFPQENQARPLMRTYTIRKQRASEIDVDFALHQQTGPAASWAKKAKPGDRILIGGPGPKKIINLDADWFLLAGDMSALPAISVNLAQLPIKSKGYAIIEITSKDDIQQLSHPENIEIHWVINPKPDPEGQTLVTKIQSLPWLSGAPAIWTACEFNSMKSLRAFFRDKKLPKSHLYISSYWKIGQSEDQHKIAKKKDSEQNETSTSL